MERHNMLGLCTSHVDDETRVLLDNELIKGVTVYDKKFGWFIPVPEGLELEEIEETCPECLYKCFNFAEKNGFDWIMFDRDVEPIDDLPTYEW